MHKGDPKLLQGSRDFKELLSEFAGVHDREIQGRHLRAVQKIHVGSFDITEEETQELYDFLDADGSGELDFREVAGLLRMVLVPPCTDREIRVLWELTDQSHDGLVSVKEVHRVLTSSAFQAHCSNMRKDVDASRVLQARSAGSSAGVTKDFFLDRMRFTVKRDDAFRTLPYTLSFFCVFIAAVVLHLRVWGKHKEETDVQNYITGYAHHYRGPLLLADVFDWADMWDWLELSFLPVLFHECSNATGSLRCPVASQSLLVGDVRLQSSSDGDSEWLLNSAVAQEHLLKEPLDLKGAALARLDELKDSGWANQLPSKMSVNFISLSEPLGVIALTEGAIRLDSQGFAKCTCVTQAVLLDPYAERSSFAVDVLYLILLLYPLYVELQDMCVGIRIGGLRDGCVAYWGLWNMVDWVSIAFGFANVLVWVLYCTGARDHVFRDLLEDPGSREPRLQQKAMQLGGDRLAAVEDHLLSMRRTFLLLRYMMAFNIFSIGLKFFKASHANPRLQLVTNTFVRAFEDIAHFGFVLVAIFMGFSLIGHILFGADIPAFNTLAQACSTSVLVLHGEFPWFRDQSVEEKGLGSGVPWTLVVIWFYLFVIFVFLVTLNMLLAIIMEHYKELVHQLRDDVDAPALWNQAWKMLRLAWSQQGHIPLTHLRAQLEDGDTACHPELHVTAGTLQKAFPGMKDEQAAFLMDWMQKETHKEARHAGGDSDSNARLKELSSLGWSLCQQIRMISLVQQKAVERMNMVHELRASHEHRVQKLVTTLQTVECHLSGISCHKDALWDRPRQLARPPPDPRGPPNPSTSAAPQSNPAPPPPPVPASRDAAAPPPPLLVAKRPLGPMPSCWLPAPTCPASLV